MADGLDGIILCEPTVRIKVRFICQIESQTVQEKAKNTKIDNKIKCNNNNY